MYALSSKRYVGSNMFTLMPQLTCEDNSVWRPLIDSVEDWPLALCDGGTVDRSDLVEADHIRRHYMGSTLYLMSNAKHRFYYLSKQSKDDVVIFKNFDSSPTVAASCKSTVEYLRRAYAKIRSCSTCVVPAPQCVRER